MRNIPCVAIFYTKKPQYLFFFSVLIQYIVFKCGQADNLANATTPNYKRKDINFEATLRKAMGASIFETTDYKIDRIRNKDLNPRVYIDQVGFSYRADGHNVDPETEAVYLAANQARYNGLTLSIDEEFKNLKAVMK